ncbi:unnamed protein product [Hapterophycus canaliculatus]
MVRDQGVRGSFSALVGCLGLLRLPFVFPRAPVEAGSLPPALPLLYKYRRCASGGGGWRGESGNGRRLSPACCCSLQFHVRKHTSTKPLSVTIVRSSWQRSGRLIFFFFCGAGVRGSKYWICM